MPRALKNLDISLGLATIPVQLFTATSSQRPLVLPRLNEQDLAKLPEEVRRDMAFVPVKTLEEVLKIALPPPGGADRADERETVALDAVR
jgi:non-homologous end joining protein Ku